MTAIRLAIAKTYQDGKDLYERDLDNSFNSITGWARTSVLNIEQLALDTHGLTYALDNDGFANLSDSIRDAATGEAKLYWKFINDNDFVGNTTFVGDTDITGKFDVTGDVTIQAGILSVTKDATTGINIDANLAGADAYIQFKNLGSNTWKIRREESIDTFTFDNATGVSVLRLYQDGILSLWSTTGNDCRIDIVSDTNKNPILRFKEYTGVMYATKWDLFNDNTTDNLTLKNISGNSVFSVNQDGLTTITTYAGGNDLLIDGSNAPAVDTDIVMNSATNRDPGMILRENGTTKWENYNDNTTDYMKWKNAAGTNVMILTQTGELYLPDIDTPTANYINQNSGVKAFCEVSNLGVLQTGSFNIDSTSQTGTGAYQVTVSTEFVANGQAVIVANPYNNDRYCSSGLLPASKVNIYIEIDDAAGNPIDDAFQMIACGKQ